jgi:hypothetical protein
MIEALIADGNEVCVYLSGDGSMAASKKDGENGILIRATEGPTPEAAIHALYEKRADA